MYMCVHACVCEREKKLAHSYLSFSVLKCVNVTCSYFHSCDDGSQIADSGVSSEQPRTASQKGQGMLLCFFTVTKQEQKSKVASEDLMK